MQARPITIDLRLQSELKPGEQLLWWGRPDLARRVKNIGSVNASYLIYGILAVAMIGLVIFDANLLIEETAFSDGPQPFTIFMLLFSILLVGVYFYRIYAVFSIMQANNNNLRNTIYAITNQRILVMTQTRQNFAVKSHAHNDIGQITRTETGEGWGDVSYGIPRTRQIGLRTVAVVDKLVGIPNARLVEDILIRTFKNPSVPPQQTWYAPQPTEVPQPYYPPAQQQPRPPFQPQE